MKRLAEPPASLRMRAFALVAFAIPLTILCASAQAQGTPTRWEVASERPTTLTSDHPPRPQTLFFVHPPGGRLEAMLQLGLPDWFIHRVAAEPTYLRIRSVLAQLRPNDAVVWIEADGPVARVTLLDSTMDNPRSSPLAVESGTLDERTFALVVQGLVRELPIGPPMLRRTEESAEPMMRFDPPLGYARSRSPRWTLLPRTWFLQVGVIQGKVSSYDPDTNTESNDHSVGVRLAAGRWVGRVLRLGALLNVAFVPYGTSYATGVELVGLSRTRVRVGGGFSLELLGGDSQGARLGFPLEVSIETARGAVFFRAGPTLTSTSVSWIGYQLALGWELH